MHLGKLLGCVDLLYGFIWPAMHITGAVCMGNDTPVTGWCHHLVLAHFCAGTRGAAGSSLANQAVGASLLCTSAFGSCVPVQTLSKVQCRPIEPCRSPQSVQHVDRSGHVALCWPPSQDGHQYRYSIEILLARSSKPPGSHGQTKLHLSVLYNWQ